MKFLPKLALLLAVVHSAMGQTNQAPIATPQINSTLYVGSLTGGVSQFFPTIQSAVTAGCAKSTNIEVNIPPAYMGSDSISAVTGCTTVWITDHRSATTSTCTWAPSVYTCTSGGGGSGTVSPGTVGDVGVYSDTTTIAPASSDITIPGNVNSTGLNINSTGGGYLYMDDASGNSMLVQAQAGAMGMLALSGSASIGFGRTGVGQASISIAPGNGVSIFGPNSAGPDLRVQSYNARQWFVYQGNETGVSYTGGSTAPTGSCTSAQGGQSQTTQDMHLKWCPVGGGTWTEPYGAGGSVTGTPFTLPQIAPGGSGTIDSPVAIKTSCTFTGAISAGSITGIVVTSGTCSPPPFVVYSSFGEPPAFITAFNAGAGTATLSGGPVTAGSYTFIGYAAASAPTLSAQFGDVSGIYIGSANAPKVGGQTTVYPSSYSISSNVLTLSGSGINIATAGTLVSIGGFPTSTFLNGLTLPVVSSSTSTVTFSLVHANVATTTEPGILTTGGAQALLAAVPCQGNGCTVELDPFDSENVPSKGFGSNVHLADVRNGHVTNKYVNSSSGEGFIWENHISYPGDTGGGGSTGNAVAENARYAGVSNFGPGLDWGFTGDTYQGGAGGEGGVSIDTTSILDYSSGISEYRGCSGYIVKAGDVNGCDNNNVYVRHATVSSSSEGFTWHRDYLNYVGDWSGTVTAVNGGALSVTTLFNTNALSTRTPMLDMTATILSGSMTLGSPVVPSTGGRYGLGSLGFAVAASNVGYLPAQNNIQGVGFTTTTAGLAPQAVTVAFVVGSAVSDGSAVSVSGNNISININAASTSSCITGATLPCNRSLTNIAGLLAGGGFSTTAGGVEYSFLGSGVNGNTASLAQTALSSEEVVAYRQPSGLPTPSTFAVVSPSAAVTTTAPLGLISYQFPEVVNPTSATLVGGHTYIVAAPLQFYHVPSDTCQGGLVGDYIEQTNYTSSATPLIAQNVWCSPTTTSIWFGALFPGGVDTRGAGGPVNIYQGADVILNSDPSLTANLATSLSGKYAFVSGYASGVFATGHTIRNTAAISENYTNHKSWTAYSPNPWSTGTWSYDRHSGFFGQWLHDLDQNDNDPCLFTIYNCGSYATTYALRPVYSLSGPHGVVISSATPNATIPAGLALFQGTKPTGAVSFPIMVANSLTQPDQFSFSWCDPQFTTTSYAFDGTTMYQFGSQLIGGGCQFSNNNGLISTFPSSTFLNGGQTISKVSTGELDSVGSTHAAVNQSTQTVITGTNTLTFTGSYTGTQAPSVGQTLTIEGCGSSTFLNGTSIGPLTTATSTTIAGPIATHSNISVTENCVVSTIEASTTISSYGYMQQDLSIPNFNITGNHLFEGDGSEACTASNGKCGMLGVGAPNCIITLGSGGSGQVCGAGATINVGGLASLQTLSVTGVLYVDFTAIKVSTNLNITGSNITEAMSSGLQVAAGTGSLQTITPLSGACGASGDNCQWTLVPTGAWTFVTGGNIACSGSVIVDRPITFTYVYANSLWYPTYGCGVSNPVFTVATLPSSIAPGYQAVVTDALTYTVGSCTGGGSDTMIAIWNGSAWSCH
jgi:hypothetical protein